MAIILDILVAAIIVLSVFLAYKKGLIKTLFSLVGGIAAVVLAVTMSAPVANWLNEEFVGPAVRNTVLTAVNGSDLNAKYDQALESVDVVGKLKDMPENLREFLENLNVDIDDIIDSAGQSKADSLAAKEKLIDSIADPVSAAISKAIALIALVIVFFILLLVATRLLDTVFRVLPFGKSLNKAGGLIFGVIRAALIVMVLGAVVYGLASGNILLSLDELDSTLLLKHINKINPILNFFK
ncbi:MAG: CvpA family protein [Clostridia bacterium]|nr:CvpA family protein [Clostridia bacterium]